MDKHQAIFNKAAECRIFLRVHGFLSDRENDKVWKRIDKYGTTFKVKKIKKIPT
jgi:hypothetical protein